MAKRNSSNQDYTNNADGWDLTGGTTPRKLTVSGGDISMVGSGAAVITFPTSTATLATLALTETFSNKSFSTAPLPSTDNGVALGSATFRFSDLFLAEGGVINWDNGDMTLTQTGNVLAIAGGQLAIGTAGGTAQIDIGGVTGAVQGLRIEAAASSDIAFSSFVTADGFIRFTFAPDGTMKWGSGSASTDTFIARTATGVLTYYTTQAAAAGPILELYQDSASPAAADVVGTLAFYGEDSASNKQEYAKIEGVILTATSGSETSYLNFTTLTGAGVSSTLRFVGGDSFFPLTSNGVALGSTAQQWSDLFLAEGGVINWDNGDATLTQVGDVVTLAGADLKVSSPGNVTTSVATVDATQTLSNKRVTPRVGTTTSSATPTINTDNVDYYSLTAQTADITSFTTNLSGTPTDNQKLWISITGTAARAITWGASFEASTVALPTTTVTTARLDVGFVWNVATSKWRCVAAA